MQTEKLWTEEQVRCLNAYQTHGRYHPFTCANRSRPGHDEMRHGDWGVLVATQNGWICPDCDYTQDWAHDFMLNYDPKEHPNWWEGNSVGELADKVVSDLDVKPTIAYIPPKGERK